jgi:hypothetical protein
VTIFWTVVPNVCGFSLWNLLHVTLWNMHFGGGSQIFGKFLAAYWGPRSIAIHHIKFITHLMNCCQVPRICAPLVWGKMLMLCSVLFVLLSVVIYQLWVNRNGWVWAYHGSVTSVFYDCLKMESFGDDVGGVQKCRTVTVSRSCFNCYFKTVVKYLKTVYSGKYLD